MSNDLLMFFVCCLKGLNVIR